MNKTVSQKQFSALESVSACLDMKIRQIKALSADLYEYFDSNIEDKNTVAGVVVGFPHMSEIAFALSDLLHQTACYSSALDRLIGQIGK